MSGRRWTLASLIGAALALAVAPVGFGALGVVAVVVGYYLAAGL